MNKKLDIHNFWRSDIFIVLMLAIISILSGILVWHGKFVVVSPDFYFHWQRIYELRDSISHGDFLPLISLNEFNQSGSAVMSMYPMINLFPMIFLSFFIKSFVNLFYIIFILKNFFSLLVGYYSCYSYTKNKKISVLFSISYTLSTFVFTLNMMGYDIGVTSAVIFLPLVLFGSFRLLSYGNWIQLSIGMSMIILCHVLTAAITIVFVLVLFIINLKKLLNKKQILNICKSVGLTMLLTSIYWVPFLYLQMTNAISLPPNSLVLDGTSFNSFIASTVDFSYDHNISLLSLIGLILSIINYKKLNDFSKQIFWISVFLIIICSKIFPWSIVQHTFIKDIIQTVWRFYVIPQILLSYLFAENILIFIKKSSYKYIYIGVIVFSIVLMHLGVQERNVNVNKYLPNLTQQYRYANGIVIIRNNAQFNNILKSNDGIPDYYPKRALSLEDNIDNHIAIYDYNKKLLVSLHGNGRFSFKAPQKIKKLFLPFLYYHGINYQVELDGKTVKGYPNKNALMTINNVHKGKHHVQIIVHKTKVEIASYMLSLIGLLILLGTVLKNFLKKRKMK